MTSRSRDVALTYPLQGTRFDVRTEAAAALPARDRFRFIRDFLKALSVEISHDRMRLLARVPFKDEMRDLRRLCRTPPGDYLRFDESRGKRDVLMFGAPGRSHVEHTAHVSWRMETNEGHVETLIKTADRRLVERINRLLTADSKKTFREARQQFLPSVFAYLKTHFAVSGAFPPFHARLLAERFLPESGDNIVVDPCAGHGGRLLGVLCAKRLGGITYIATDPNRRNQPAYKTLLQRVTKYLAPRDVKGQRSATVYPQPFEDWINTAEARRLYGRVSLVMTSPPYFSQERYDPKNSRQSASRYVEFADWRRQFLHPLIRGAARLLRPGGVFVLNIADVCHRGRVFPLEKNSVDHATRAAGFVLQDTLRLAMPVRPGGQKLALRHSVHVANEGKSTRWKYEPVFCFRRVAGPEQPHDPGTAQSIHYATPGEWRTVYDALRQRKDVFPHVRSDYVRRMCEQSFCIHENGVSIVFQAYRKSTRLGSVIAPAGSVVLHQIVNAEPGNGRVDEMFRRFCVELRQRFGAMELFLTVRASNRSARRF